MQAKREKANEKLKSYAKLLDLAYNDAAGALRHAEVRHKLSNGGTAIDSALGFGKGALVALFNSDSAIHYYKTGDSTVTAPSGPTNGIPIAPGALIVVPLGDDAYVRSDSDLVFAYTIDEDTQVQ